MNQHQETREAQPQFTFNVVQPFTDADDSSSPFVIGGLFKEGGLSSLVAKPKQGKSSLSRYAAVCVAKGAPFLGRPTQRGEALLISIEDPLSHVNTCLRALDYDPAKDEAIHLIDRVSPHVENNLGALRTVLEERPNVRLVVIDTLAKFVRIKDINDYNAWLPVFEQFRNLGRDFPHISILCLVHSKKTQADDPFDSMLGSSALRGEFDTNAAIFRDGNDRLFVTESRMGKALQPSILNAELIEMDDSDVVRNFSLGRPLDEVRSEQRERGERKRKLSHEDRIITYLSHRPNESAIYGMVIEEVEGNDQRLIEALTALIEGGVLKASGTKGSPTNPYTVALDRTALKMRDFINRSQGRVN